MIFPYDFTKDFFENIDFENRKFSSFSKNIILLDGVPFGQKYLPDLGVSVRNRSGVFEILV